MTDAPEKTEVVVIGAGVIGLAVARELALAGREVLIIEAEKHIGSATSSRNSGVIHAGLYYPPGSLKALTCVRGRTLLYQYAEERQIPYKKCGKLIVATGEGQQAALMDIMARAEACGVHDLSLLSSGDIRQMEPEITAVGGIFSPSSGIIDAHEFMHSLLGDATSNGALLALKSPVASIAIEGSGFTVEASGAKISCQMLINAAGLAAQPVARRMKGLDPASIPPQFLAKGNYFSLGGPPPFRTLVYPVPEDGGLGIHATLDMSGRIRFGPDVEWLGKADSIDYAVDPKRATHFYEAIRHYWLGLKDSALQPDYAGIRPKLSAKGAPNADFMVQGEKEHGIKGLMQFYGIESPGLTAALALAEHAGGLLADY